MTQVLCHSSVLCSRAENVSNFVQDSTFGPLRDYKARMLVKGLRKLKIVDFSTSYSFTGAFLKNLGSNGGGKHLEVMILRDCMHLKEVKCCR
ncbi:hypothetical protein Hdeb2414_s0639g00927921 [Helianthus debilis subsp. tardiflorus]